MARGCAKNSEAIREYLMNCEAVSAVRTGSETITFTFDPAKVPDEVPEGVWFDTSKAPF